MEVKEEFKKGNNITNNIPECCGCAACANVCPVDAIRIIQDNEGFYKPFIDENKCISCGKCSNICPITHNKFNNKLKPKTYAIFAPDEIRKISSSGGIFTIIANEILENNGIVCGAAFNKEFKVEHILVNKKEDLTKLRGSKYVQSYISEDLYRQIQNFLEMGTYVLFTGVPCQVAGLLNFLKKDYDNLYTIDLICAYAPSPKVFEQYLTDNFNKHELANVKFRSKDNIYWEKSIQQLQLEKTNGEKVFDSKYMTPYLNRLFKGTHCEQCKFKKFPRPADFTIGDFWKIDQFAKDMNDKKGTSALLLNTNKSEIFFERIKNKLKKVKEMPLNSAGWQIDVKNIIYKTPACKNFYKNIDTLPYNQNIIEAEKQAKVGIINWWFVNNRGAILTNYALNEMIKSLGYEALTINYISPMERENFKNSFAEDFANKYLKRTRWIPNLNALKTLNNEISTFICGSDQIFRYYPCKVHDMIFYLNWVDANINKLISYSASFAVNKFEATFNQTNLVKHYLSRFDYHSIREYDGVDLMKNTFGIECPQVLDPVFCINKEKYVDMAEKSDKKIDDDFIAYYIMWPTKERLEIVKHIQNLTGIKKAIYLNPPMSIENWLWYIQNAKYIVTDSFHGTCFSLIFNKQFVVIPNETEYPSRFKSLEQLSGLSSRFFYNNAEIYNSKELLEPIVFSEFNSKIKNEITRSILWLKTALNNPKHKFLTPEQEIYDAIIEDYTEKINHIYIKLEKEKNRNNDKKMKIKNILSNIFSIKNEYTKDKKYKILTIFGIKIKHSKYLKK